MKLSGIFNKKILLLFILASIIFMVFLHLKLNTKNKETFENCSSILITICSKSPNPYLYDCVKNIYLNQIDDTITYKVCIVDSGSDDLSNYNKVKNDYPDVDICFANNKNYEFGAWKYAYEKNPNFDAYFCIQDSIMINKKIPINLINNNLVYTFKDSESGYNSHKGVKNLGIKYLRKTELNYNDIIDTNFFVATHCSFIVTNSIIKDIFETFKDGPVNKEGSCTFERLFGIYFITKGIETIGFHNYASKIHGKRM
jgi:hypothetical protein